MTMLTKLFKRRPRHWALRVTLENGKTISWTQPDDGRELYEQQVGLVGERIITVETRIDDGNPWSTD